MPGAGGRDGVDIRAGGGVHDEVDDDLRRGGEGYEDGAETNGGGVGEVGGAVRRLIEALERRIKELEEDVLEAGREEEPSLEPELLWISAEVRS